MSSSLKVIFSPELFYKNHFLAFGKTLAVLRMDLGLYQSSRIWRNEFACKVVFCKNIVWKDRSGTSFAIMSWKWSYWMRNFISLLSWESGFLSLYIFIETESFLFVNPCFLLDGSMSLEENCIITSEIVSAAVQIIHFWPIWKVLDWMLIFFEIRLFSGVERKEVW